MSQAHIKPAGALPQYPLDEFQQLTVSSSTGFVAGELVTGGTTGATAKVSGIIDGTTLRVKAVKPGASSVFASETITGNKSSQTATVSGTPLTKANKRVRNVAGTPTLVTEDHLMLTDQGFVKTYWNPSTTTDRGILGRTSSRYETVATAIRMGMSKSENTDTSTGPTFTYYGPAATSSAVVYSLAARSGVTFHIESNETLSVTGTPQIGFSFSSAGTAHGTHALTVQTISVTGATSTGGTLTGISSTAAMQPGQVITVATGGTNIVGGTIVSIASSSSVVIATTGTPSGTVTAISTCDIVSVTGAGGVATVVMAEPTNYRVGQQVAIASMTTTGFNNATAVVTSVSTDTKTFTYANATTGSGTIGPGTVTLTALQYASMTGGFDGVNMYFSYTLSGAEPTGALASTTSYNANSAVIGDIIQGTTPNAVTPAPNGLWSPAVTGVVIAA